MAIYVETSMPRTLVRAIRRRIDNEQVETWAYDDDGDFTHTALQWKHKAWLRPHVKEGMVVFGIVPPLNRIVTREIYSIYMGRFAELLVKHSYMHIRKLRISPSPSDLYDNMGGDKDEE